MDENRHFSDYLDPSLIQTDNGIFLSWKLLFAFVFLMVIVFFIWYLSSSKRRRHLYFYFNYFIYKLGFRPFISRKQISRVHVNEDYTPLVELIPHPRIIYNDETMEKPYLLRKSVAKRLFSVADNLPDGLSLKVYSTFRSKEKQNILWKETVNEIRKENPNLGTAEIINMAQYKTNDPKHTMGGHETGAAVDVALCTSNGEDLDFGTSYHERNSLTKTFSKNIKKEQFDNRKLLIKLMAKEGFINFPGEWWHFSYGDRVWSAYKGKRNGAIFDTAEKELDGVYSFVVKTIYFSNEH
ncbi:MAG TPA: D-alanyl-D-alanine carboxypeptidase family protein [Bacteroidetes bacterium]|nr:D-alanyl-D-alanine carboxypeptidase family protein [Candidatus Limimorpha avicola]